MTHTAERIEMIRLLQAFKQGDEKPGMTILRALRAKKIAARSGETWECMGRKQSLPEPGECSWPDCGCDPHATKVIESLLEQGWSPAARPVEKIEGVK